MAKGFIKGLAAGAVVGAVAALYSTMHGKDKKAKEFRKTADAVTKKVAAHAKNLGKLTKSAYNTIVDTTLGEYKGVKALSQEELDELRDELKDSFDDIVKVFKK